MGPECGGAPFCKGQQVDRSIDGTRDMQCFSVVFWMKGRQVLMILSAVLSTLIIFFQTSYVACTPHRDAAEYVSAGCSEDGQRAGGYILEEMPK